MNARPLIWDSAQAERISDHLAELYRVMFARKGISCSLEYFHKRRFEEFAALRHIVRCSILRYYRITPHRLADVEQLLGLKRDHSSIYYALGRIDQLQIERPELYAEVQELLPLTSAPTMPFGYYKGKPLSEVRTEFLRHCLENNLFETYPKHREWVANHLQMQRYKDAV